jgi:hypothetical protein
MSVAITLLLHHGKEGIAVVPDTVFFPAFYTEYKLLLLEDKVNWLSVASVVAGF